MQFTVRNIGYDVQSEIRSEALQLVLEAIEYYILMNKEMYNNNRIKSDYMLTQQAES